MIRFTTNGNSLMVRAEGEDALLVVGMAAGLMQKHARGGGWGLDYIHDETQCSDPSVGEIPTEVHSVQEKHGDGGTDLAQDLAVLAWYFRGYPAYRALVEVDTLFMMEVNRRLKQEGKRPYYPEQTVTVQLPVAQE